jgi:hypothetical protein
VFGVWGACSALGGLAGTLQANIIRGVFGWVHVYWIPAIAAGLAGLAVHRFLRLPSGISAMMSDCNDGDRVGSPGDSASDTGGVNDKEHELLLLGDTYATHDRVADTRSMRSVQSLGSVYVSKSKSLGQLLKIPLVKEAAAVYFFVNILRSAVAMWLPIYLHL